MIRPTPAIEAIPSTTPFVGPEQLMRETGHRGLLRLGANESAFGPSPKAIAAMAAELERLSWYGDPESLDLRDALAQKHDCFPEQILVGSGIDDVMGLAVRAFVAPGAIALTSRGTYPTFNYHVIGYGGRLAFASYREDGMPDLDALLAVARRERATIVYLANPDNPSGRFIGRADVARFYGELPHDSLLLLDEAYADFVAEDELLTPHFEDRLIRMRTFSKAYGMAGARIGYALTTAANVRTFQKIRLHYGINRNAQIGALASLDDDEFRTRVVSATAQARNDYYALARSLGLRYLESHANFVCIDLGTPERATNVMNDLLRRAVWI
ncbi:MAG: aminotransferase class I/II-fold pyridoxal phosphate-dependent enzyme, partial [Candidatus Eremiobacteraeota bacterium]|nr:aminotransferase class I/II-fold pyridoxal phosphate-dependent enzyme [Candidatus Eremiobacteraeota bacterium]